MRQYIVVSHESGGLQYSICIGSHAHNSTKVTKQYFKELARYFSGPSFADAMAGEEGKVREWASAGKIFIA